MYIYMIYILCIISKRDKKDISSMKKEQNYIKRKTIWRIKKYFLELKKYQN